jgi:hypothetical protein
MQRLKSKIVFIKNILKDERKYYMNKIFLVSGLITTIVNLLLQAAAYLFNLKDFYQSYPAVSEEFMKQLHRPPDQLIVWAMVVTSFSMGFLEAISKIPSEEN